MTPGHCLGQCGQRQVGGALGDGPRDIPELVDTKGKGWGSVQAGPAGKRRGLGWPVARDRVGRTTQGSADLEARGRSQGQIKGPAAES